MNEKEKERELFFFGRLIISFYLVVFFLFVPSFYLPLPTVFNSVWKCLFYIRKKNSINTFFNQLSLLYSFCCFFYNLDDFLFNFYLYPFTLEREKERETWINRANFKPNIFFLFFLVLFYQRCYVIACCYFLLGRNI